VRVNYKKGSLNLPMVILTASSAVASRDGKIARIGVSVANGRFSLGEMKWFLANLRSETSWQENSYGRFFLHVPCGVLEDGLSRVLVVVAEDEE
jgi:hypothetical protein